MITRLGLGDRELDRDHVRGRRPDLGAQFVAADGGWAAISPYVRRSIDHGRKTDLGVKRLIDGAEMGDGGMVQPKYRLSGGRLFTNLALPDGNAGEIWVVIQERGRISLTWGSSS